MTRSTYGDALIAQTTNGVSHFYQYDGLGSVRGLTDATGAVTDAYAYDAYGLLLEQTGASANPYLYRGEQYDPETDAYYLRARYYQPGLGRFLTMDAEEGFETDPLSLHKYVYSSNDPMNNIDPSGRMTLNEQLAVGTIITNLSMIAIGSSLEAKWGVYSTLGERLFPDAYTLGIYGTLSVRVLKHFLTYTNHVGLGGNYSSIQRFLINGVLGGGVELVLNITSAQVGLFLVLPTVGGQMGTYTSWKVPTASGYAGWGAYQGYVWNLWSIHDYKGNFVSFGTGGETYTRSFGFTAFCDPTRLFSGPWGFARTLFENKLRGNPLGFDKKASRFYGYSYYWLLGHLDRPTEAEVGGYAMTLSILANVWQAKQDPLAWGNKGFICVEPSIWLQTTIAKYFWNMKSQYNREYRQQYSKERPKDFQSGPSLAIFSLFGG